MTRKKPKRKPRRMRVWAMRRNGYRLDVFSTFKEARDAAAYHRACCPSARVVTFEVVLPR